MNSGLCFFFIGSERLPAIMKEQAERLNQVKTLKVDYLDRQALIDMVKEPVKGSLEFTVIAGFEQRIRFIEDNVQHDVIVLSQKVLIDADKAFSPENRIFETDEEGQRAYDIAYRIGLVLQKDHPLGFNDAQALIVFSDNVPNNTLPIFHRTEVEYNGRPWISLFPRST